MSRVHDALRRAEQSGAVTPPAPRSNGDAHVASSPSFDAGPNLAGLLEQVQEVPFRTATDSLLIDVSRPHEAPMEEFRTLRTRLNHMKSLQPIHSVRVDCLPTDIPEAFEVDLTPLEEIESEFRISELKVPKGVTVLMDPEELVVKIVHRRELKVEEEAPVLETAVVGEGEEGAEAGAPAAEEAETEK